MNMPFEASADEIKLINLLQDWADWQRGYNAKLGYPRRSAGLQSGYVSTSFDEMCDQMDKRICRIVDTAIDDLSIPKRSAITHRYLASVFRFRISYVELLDLAHKELLANLKRKGIL